LTTSGSRTALLAKSAQDNEGESWDEMIARFGDTWT
jgi:hypothetical protein